jgi:putative transposase
VVTDAYHPEMAAVVGTKQACRLFGRARATHYRRCRPSRPTAPTVRPSPPNVLSETERQAVLDLLHRPEHCDLAVAQVWSRTLDDGTYLCSQSTMHRLLSANGESKDRRRQRTHPAKKKPELMATRPNEVWSWDISKLKGPVKGDYYDLYVIIDIFSRYVVGWLVAPFESADVAKDFLHDSVLTQGVDRDSLTIHADRGSSMRSKPVSHLLVDLGVGRSHSRPHVSNDNPYSEAAFKTLKYCSAFPDRFGSIEDARAFCAEFFEHYNHVHRHSGIALHTPASVHYGTAREIRDQRQATLSAAYAANPIRFRHRPPTAPRRGVDQSAAARGGYSELVNQKCLKSLDRFRTGPLRGAHFTMDLGLTRAESLFRTPSPMFRRAPPIRRSVWAVIGSLGRQVVT